MFFEVCPFSGDAFWMPRKAFEEIPILLQMAPQGTPRPPKKFPKAPQRPSKGLLNDSPILPEGLRKAFHKRPKSINKAF